MFRVVVHTTRRAPVRQATRVNYVRTVSTMPEGVFPDEALRQATAPTPKDFSKTDRNALEEAFGVPVEQLERKVYISKPAKTASQHGWGVCVL